MAKKITLFISATLLTMTIFSGHAIATVTTITLSFVGETNTLAFMGVSQGRDEANIQGMFLGQRYSFTGDVASSTAIFAAVGPYKLRQLSISYPNKAIFNLIAKDNELRTECLPNVLHIIPSELMLADAVAQWHKKQPGEQVRAQTWHPSFKKYAASQLNARFTQSSNHKMDDEAWAGWAAVKLLSDSIGRSQITDPLPLLQFLKTQLAFDGQKGIALDFRQTGQLRQPLLLINNNKIVGEAPVRGVANTINLDSLGITRCLKSPSPPNNGVHNEIN